ncbi:hypothetical protein ACF1BQ_019320 [Bradyrhizobium sp. RDT10]
MAAITRARQPNAGCRTRHDDGEIADIEQLLDLQASISIGLRLPDVVNVIMPP